MTKAHPVFRRQIARVEHAVQELASTAEAVLRKHGKEIVEKQFATRRLADVAIDLLAMSAVVARTTHLIGKRGSRACMNEIDMTNAFCQDAIRRIRANFRAAQRNNDEEIKAVADRAMAEGGYLNDVLKD
jgi:acyl-CoA dehydrogenase family protein 9